MAKFSFLRPSYRIKFRFPYLRLLFAFFVLGQRAILASLCSRASPCSVLRNMQFGSA